MWQLLLIAALFGFAMAGEASLRASEEAQAWVFAYGSLINADSRAKQGATGPAVLASVARARRQWAACVNSKRQYVAVAIERTEDLEDTVNGVIFRVSKDSLLALDKREEGYDRVELPWNEVHFDASHLRRLSRPVTSRDKVYVYLGKGLARALETCADFPISQAYIDVIMSGIKSVVPEGHAAGAMRDFVRSTHGWHSVPYVDDRIAPLCRYPLRDERRGTRGDLSPELSIGLEREIDAALDAVHVQGSEDKSVLDLRTHM